MVASFVKPLIACREYRPPRSGRVADSPPAVAHEKSFQVDFFGQKWLWGVNYYGKKNDFQPFLGNRTVTALRNHDEFVRRFVRSQQSLYAYILTLVPNTADAQDILQETAVALWAKADDYDPNEPFMPWACQFAWQQVRKFRLYQARRLKHVASLSDEALTALMADRSRLDETAAARGQKLQDCVTKLVDDDRRLLSQRYDNKVSMREAAEQRGVEPNQLYKRLGRIRQTLLDCINNAIAMEERKASPTDRAH
jgi:RNA polymerase sigma-70 factor (ECF subfamily)